MKEGKKMKIIIIIIMIIIIISENKNSTSFDAACTQFASNVELKIDDAEDYFNWPKNI